MHSYSRGDEDYAAIRDLASNPQQEPAEVTESEYWEMLECLPPKYVRGVPGFLVCEAITEDERGTVYANYFERGGRFWARYHVIKRSVADGV